MGCSTAADTPEFEVLQPMEGSRDIRVGRVCFDRRSTLESPFFWTLFGIGLGLGIAYYCTSSRDRR